MEIKRISKYSQIKLLNIDEFNKQANIIQAVKIEDYQLFFVEYIPEQYKEEYILENYKNTENKNTDDNVQMKTQDEMALETALDTVLNNDPLGRYNGCNLREPFDKQDYKWIDWVLENMHNKFIKDKVKLIKESGYGR